MHRTQDEEKLYKKHNTICVGHQHTQDYKTKTNNTKSTTQYVLDTNIHRTEDEDKQYKKHNPICVAHHHSQHTSRRQTIQKAQPNMCWTPPYTAHKTNTNNTKSTTQYVLDTNIHRTEDEDKQYKKHNPICVVHHHTQHTRRRQTIQKAQPNMCWTLTYT
jgi:predicted nucleotidyltransferase